MHKEELICFRISSSINNRLGVINVMNRSTTSIKYNFLYDATTLKASGDCAEVFRPHWLINVKAEHYDILLHIKTPKYIIQNLLTYIK